MQVNGFKSKAAAIRAIRAKGYNITGLLTAENAQPKTAKNGKRVQVSTRALMLSPHKRSGYNTCAQASPGCIDACLHTAGNPAYMDAKEKSRIAKTRAYFELRAAFMAVLVFEIAAHQNKAKAREMLCGVRLNGTSDIPWESVAFEVDGTKYANVMAYFPEIAFYDYSKITKRALRFARGDMPENYHITFSKTEDNDAAVSDVIDAQGNVAIVFDLPTYKAVLARGVYRGLQVVDGDKHDFRPLDGKGVIVALKEKGKARNDVQGFVVREVAA